jgi:hypothetical protein
MSAAKRFFNFPGTDAQYIALLERGYCSIRRKQPDLFNLVPELAALLPSTDPRDDQTSIPDLQVKGTLADKSDNCKRPPPRSRQQGADPKEQTRTQPPPPSRRTRAQEHDAHGGSGTISHSEGTVSKDHCTLPPEPKGASLDSELPTLTVCQYDPRNPPEPWAKDISTRKTSVSGSRAASCRPRRTNSEKRKQPASPSQGRQARAEGIRKRRPSISRSEETDPNPNTSWPHLDTIPKTDDQWNENRKVYGLDTIDQVRKVLSTLASVDLTINFGGVTDRSLGGLGHRIVTVLRQKTRFDGITRLLVPLFFSFCLVVECVAKKYDGKNDSDRQLLEKAFGDRWESLKDLQKVERNQEVRKSVDGWLREVIGEVTGQRSSPKGGHLGKLRRGVVNIINTLEDVYEKEGGNCTFELIVYYSEFYILRNTRAIPLTNTTRLLFVTDQRTSKASIPSPRRSLFLGSTKHESPPIGTLTYSTLASTLVAV